ncbi:hypothetical protein HC891_18375 [Candidatus Gracilibacteria bacterium]|nr:hypothetical protein [Candidatus Gracilibacteria bacterium]
MVWIIGQLVPLILGAMLAPLWIIIVLLLLASPNGFLKAIAFVAGMTVSRLLQGVVFGFVFASSPDAAAEGDGASPVVSTLLLIVGILLLIAAYRKWRKEEDPDAPPPQWMQNLEQTTPLKALGLGAGLVGIGVKLWVFTLSALGIISAAGLALGSSVVLYLLYIVLAQLLLILPIVGYALAPKASAAILQRALDWLTRYNRPISITVALFFGVYFTWDGIQGLLS